MSEGDGSGGGWRRRLTRLAYRAEGWVDAARARWGRRRSGPLIVVPYRGYGDGRRLRVRGRVLVGRAAGPDGPGAGALTNLRAAWRRFDSAEAPHARVRVAAGPAAGGDGPAPGEVEAIADEEGHVDVVIELASPSPAGWAPVRIELLEPRPAADAPRVFRGEALVPRRDAPYGVISDMDDTVLVTGAARLLEVATRTLLQSAHDRLPFPGVPALYRAFAAAGAPTFYVSSSPWNLYGPLTEFLDLNGVPRGPLALRDWGLADDAAAHGHAGHKNREIEAILAAFPSLRFVLIGDSGQEDPEIYAGLAVERPGRVAGVLIRHVAGAERGTEVEALADRVRASGVPFALVTDSAQAARVAEAQGWIDAAGRRATEEACRTEAGAATSPTEDAPGRV
jgi:phosphatidate phosphatase APP1